MDRKEQEQGPRTITVGELIEELQGQDPDARVVFSSDYGDHCHTEQAHAIRGNVEEVLLVESAYSGSRWAVTEQDEEELTARRREFVRILRIG